jgi:hypothetical protein
MQVFTEFYQIVGVFSLSLSWCFRSINLAERNIKDESDDYLMDNSLQEVNAY